MRWLAALLLLTAALAGCASDPEPQEGPDAVPDAPDVPDTVDPGVNTTGADQDGLTLRFNLSEMEYEDSLKRVAIHAQSNGSYAAVGALSMGPYANRDDCAVAAVSLQRPSGAPPGAAFASDGNGSQQTAEGNASDDGPAPRGVLANGFLGAWAYHNTGRARVVVAGEGLASVEPLQDDQSGQLPAEGDLDMGGRFQAGDVILVEMGGHTTRYAESRYQDPDDPSTYRQNMLSLELEVNGSARVQELPDAPLRCGMGPHQAEDADAYAVAQASAATVGGTISLRSGNASTMFVQDTQGLLEDAYELRFHDATSPPTSSWIQAADEPGEMAIVFQQDEETLPEMAWLMADAYWPVLLTVEG